MPLVFFSDSTESDRKCTTTVSGDATLKADGTQTVNGVAVTSLGDPNDGNSNAAAIGAAAGGTINLTTVQAGETNIAPVFTKNEKHATVSIF